MTRIEEIKQKAEELGQKYFPNEYNIWARENIEAKYVELAFIEGVKWADEHPNLYNDEKYHTVKVSCLDELYRKSELYDAFLEKVCKYLDNNFPNIGNVGSWYKEDFIKQFKKAMEG